MTAGLILRAVACSRLSLGTECGLSRFRTSKLALGMIKACVTHNPQRHKDGNGCQARSIESINPKSPQRSLASEWCSGQDKSCILSLEDDGETNSPHICGSHCRGVAIVTMDSADVDISIEGSCRKVKKWTAFADEFLPAISRGNCDSLELGARLRGRTTTHASKKGSEKVLGRVLRKGSQKTS